MFIVHKAAPSYRTPEFFEWGAGQRGNTRCSSTFGASVVCQDLCQAQTSHSRIVQQHCLSRSLGHELRFFKLATGERAFTGLTDADFLFSICQRLTPPQFTNCPPANQWAAHPSRFEMVTGSPPLEPLAHTAKECVAWSTQPPAEAATAPYSQPRVGCFQRLTEAHHLLCPRHLAHRALGSRAPRLGSRAPREIC